jgi:tetratricopeptide (TPR) repeat protein
MSLFDSFKKNAALKNAINQIASARQNSGEKADALFSKAYHGFQEAIYKDLLVSQSLYNWGFGLLHQAKTKSGEEAVALYQDAIAKFSFCLTIDPDYLGAAIDGGVALMELARLQQVKADDSLYASAKRSFEKANQIQKGSASYNLACLYSLCHDEDACLSALKNAKENGSLPNVDDIMADPDLLNVANKAWFIDFVESLTAIEPQPVLEHKAEAATEANAEAATATVSVSEVEPEIEPVVENQETEKSADNDENSDPSEEDK